MESMEDEGRAAEMEFGGKRRSAVAGKREGKELKRSEERRVGKECLL